MKTKIFFILITIQLTSYCIAQQSSIFEITENKELKGDSYIFYSDLNDQKHTGSPSFQYQMPIDKSLVVKFPSKKEVQEIKDEFFSGVVLKRSQRLLAICKIHVPSGTIVSVSFSVKNMCINIEKLEECNKKIKEEIKFGISFNHELTKEGYIYKTLPLLRFQK